MATLKPLLVLKSTALKSLAVSLGVNSSGTKSEVASRIVGVCRESVPFFERSQKDVQQNSRVLFEGEALGIGEGEGRTVGEKREKRVLSIDMGIRNLAMCVLEVPNYRLKETGKRGRKKKGAEVMESFPKILAWERIAVAEKPVVEESPSPPAEMSGLGEAEKKTKEKGERNSRSQEQPPVTPEEATDLDRSEKKKGKRKVKKKNDQPEEPPPTPLEEVPIPDAQRGKKGKRKTKEVKPGEILPAPSGGVFTTLNESGEKGQETKTEEIRLGEPAPVPLQEVSIPDGQGKKKRGKKKEIQPKETSPAPPKEVFVVLDGTGEKGGEVKTEGVRFEEPAPAPLQEVPIPDSQVKKRRGKKKEIQPKETSPAPSEEVSTTLDESGEKEGEMKAEEIRLGEPAPAPPQEALVPDGQGKKKGGRKKKEIQPKEISPTPSEEVSTALDESGKKRGETKTEGVRPGDSASVLLQKGIPEPGEIEKKGKKRGPKKFLIETPESLLFNPYSAPYLDFEEPENKETKKSRRVKKKAESFEPSLYAFLANSFVRQLLTRFSPIDAILIERQRYRSHGASAIQEWTVRVNMFEAMLHAVFYCLHGEASPAAESVNPDRVTRFWVDRVGEKYLEVKNPGRRKRGNPEDGLGDKLALEGVVEVKRHKTYNRTKLAKISLVTEWLGRGDVVSLGEGVKEIAANFMPHAKKRGRRVKNTSGGKLDDLADCFLQGMAWIRWEENRRDLADGRLIPEFVLCESLES